MALEVTALAAIDHPGMPGLYAGGAFEAAGGAPARVIARWDGAAWRPLPMDAGIVPLGGPVSTITAFDDGSGPALYVGGNLVISLQQGGKTGLLKYRNGVWTLPSAGSVTASSSSSPTVRAACPIRSPEPALWITGGFNEAGGAQTSNFAALHACPACLPDCNSDGTLNAADFGCFQARFMSADPWADCNQDAALTVADFACFQGSFAVGFP